MPRWLRVVVGAFVLSAWLTVAVSGGVAHADGPPSTDGESSSQDGQGRHEAKPDTPRSVRPDSPRRPGGLLQRPTRHRDSLVRDRKPNRVEANADDTASTTPSPGRSASKPDADAADVPESEPSAKPKLWQIPRTLHGDRRVDLTVAAVKPLKALKPATVAPPRPALTHRALSSVQTPDLKPLAATISPANPQAPATSARTGAVDVPQLGRQATGLVSDIGVVAASVVFTVADTVASAFGPNDFAGVPYALATALANTAAAASRAVIGAPLDADSPGRFRVTYGVLDGLSFFNPQQPPPGANDDSIDVSAEHPLPIILLNGTTATQGTNWGVGAPVLANAGYKVYTFNYGNVTNNPNSPIQATGDIRKSADELDAEIDRVLEETGAEKVILIGHSQGGGILPAYYINNVEGGAEKVSQVIGIAPSNHGTDFNGLVGLLNVPVFGPLVVAVTNIIGPALIQQTVGSDFQQVVYGDQDTDPRVIYTNIITRNDEIVTPYTQQALEGDNVTNIVLQDRYPGYPAGHLGVVLSPQVWSIVLEELEANPEANPLLHPDSEELAA
jgi:triacylglycerol esterase/lipase EstA (alpha/beta hydrolase family)